MTQGYLIGEVVRRITGETLGAWFAREVAAPLGADFFIGLPESEEHRVSLVIPCARPDLRGVDRSSILWRTMSNPPLDPTYPHHAWWRRAEIPAANGHGNARSVALVQSIVTGGGEARGVRLLAEKGLEPIFDVQAEGRDLVLGLPTRIGMGYGLGHRLNPIGPRACYWGGLRGVDRHHGPGHRADGQLCHEPDGERPGRAPGPRTSAGPPRWPSPAV